ncbi:hypothetical protein SUGI_0010680 [Cryptomeria japonica]|nr:hypothetical protein SUGI_0010680 [Cryptomeria japonica]
MKIISHNMRSLNGLDKCRLLKRLVEVGNLDVLIMQETKVDAASLVGMILHFWKNGEGLVVDAIGTTGGLVDGCNMILTNVYGHNLERDRKIYWDDLKVFPDTCHNENWVIGGNFNTTLTLGRGKVVDYLATRALLIVGNFVIISP